ncbi:MAG: MerR family transcriptional regulator [Flavobacteriales bacterium]
MLINELSKKVEMSIHTIRYYENWGLIEGLSDENVKTNNYKDYDKVAVERLQIIKEAKEVGFTLKEIRQMLDSWFGSNEKFEEQIVLFNSKIQEVDEKIRRLKQIKKRLVQVVDELGKREC